MSGTSISPSLKPINKAVPVRNASSGKMPVIRNANPAPAKAVNKDDPLADTQRSLAEIQAQKAIKATPEQIEQKSYLQMLDKVETKLSALDMNMDLEKNDALDASSTEFNQLLHDATFNFGRRFPNVEMGGKKIGGWADAYGMNYKAIEKEAQKLSQLPNKEKKRIYNAVRLAAVTAILSPKETTEDVTKMLKGDMSPRSFIEKQMPALETLEKNIDNEKEFPLGKDAKKLHGLSVMETQYFLRYLTKQLSPKETFVFEKNIKKLNNLMESEPTAERPRVFLAYTSREGHIGDLADKNAAFANSGFTANLYKYWKDQGCDVIKLDASGGNHSQDLQVQKAFEAFKGAGFFMGGGYDPNAKDPFVGNFKKLIDYADKKEMPYMTECLTMQMLAMVAAGETDYLKYTDIIKDKSKHIQDGVSVLDTSGMERDHLLYKEPLASFLKARREASQEKKEEIEPIKVTCVHNNIVDITKKMKENLAIAAYSADCQKSPEVLTKQEKSGKRIVVGTQFHPGDIITGRSKTRKKMNQASEDFNTALINTSIEDIKEYNRAHCVTSMG